MDNKTIDVYNRHADYFLEKYCNSKQGMSKYFSRSIGENSKILDIGCGIGRDLAFLLEKGYDAQGIDLSEPLLKKGEQVFPIIKGKVVVDGLPDFKVIKENFDTILCSAILMHIPLIQLFDSAVAIRNHLKPGGGILFSIPKDYPSINFDTSRDTFGRLFNCVTINQLTLIFERLGFRLIEIWEDESMNQKEKITWQTAFMKYASDGPVRPLDAIESVINNDQKVATYKLALFRALAEIAMTNSKAVKWNASGVVYLPVDLVIDKWIDYYWPIFESEIFIPQIQKEYDINSKPVAFRKPFLELINNYRFSGGYDGFKIDRMRLKISPENLRTYGSLKTKLRTTIIKGPVAHAGGINASSRIFNYDQKGNIIIPDLIWKELTLLGSWIIDASILRWAELTSKFSKGNLKSSFIIDLLLVEEKTRQIDDAKRIYLKHRNEIVCVWTSHQISNFDIDHIMPFSLWKNNDLWNLVPSSPKINKQKSDKIVTLNLVNKSRDNIISDWKILFNYDATRFLNEAKILTGNYLNKANWENSLFAGLKESLESTAIQRGIERWEPKHLSPSPPLPLP